MRAVIPVAGVGARLRPHTYSLPKVLLNVAGKPILGHILDAIIEQGVEKATIITGYMGKLIQDYVRSNYKLDVEFVSQKESLGLGHAIWVGKDTYKADEPLMIILGDTIFDIDLKTASGSDCSAIGVKYVEDPRRFGVVISNPAGYIEKFVEKPVDPVSNMAIVGLYYIAKPMELVSCLDEIIEKDIRTKDEYQLTDALEMALQKGVRFKTFPVAGWYDCGKPETLLDTNRYLLSKNSAEEYPEDCVIVPPVFIGKNTKIERSVIGPNTTVADGATVTDSVVRDTIISDDASVHSSLLEGSIIGNNAVVRGNFLRLNVGNSSEINYM